MSTNTDVLPGVIPAGVTHTISRAFLLHRPERAKVEKPKNVKKYVWTTFLQGISNPRKTGTCETNECIDPREKVLDREKLCDLTKNIRATGTKQHKVHDPELQYHNRNENDYFFLLMHSSNTQPQAEVVIYLITNSLCE